MIKIKTKSVSNSLIRRIYWYPWAKLNQKRYIYLGIFPQRYPHLIIMTIKDDTMAKASLLRIYRLWYGYFNKAFYSYPYGISGGNIHIMHYVSYMYGSLCTVWKCLFFGFVSKVEVVCHYLFFCFCKKKNRYQCNNKKNANNSKWSTWEINPNKSGWVFFLLSKRIDW